MLVSTRSGLTETASLAVLRGLAPDGGLYVPETFPKFTPEDIARLIPLAYPARAARVMAPLLDDLPTADVEAVARAAYGGALFDACGPAPLSVLNGNTFLLELYHGPTLAFKDMALTALPRLLPLAARRSGVAEEIVVVAATSGDTGTAALTGFCDVPGTRCVVFYPKDGVSRAQYLQMVTQGGGNTHVVAVRGNFDDAQAGVKRVFLNGSLGETLAAGGRRLSSANSINYGRLAPQVAYYFSAYADLAARSALRVGDPVHFAVPTGNFGNILAALYAKRMGLPVGLLLCASNANRVLADFIKTGVYDINRAFHKTRSPSMDILVSSNLERYLFELAGRDPSRVVAWMGALREKGHYRVEPDILRALNAEISGGWVADGEDLRVIARAFHEARVLIDPHTAVAAAVLDRYRARTGDPTPAVVVGTASPFKFGRAVAHALEFAGADDFACCRALARLVGMPLPQTIARLPGLPVRHTRACEPEAMEAQLLEILQ